MLLSASNRIEVAAKRISKARVATKLVGASIVMPYSFEPPDATVWLNRNCSGSGRK